MLERPKFGLTWCSKIFIQPYIFVCIDLYTTICVCLVYIYIYILYCAASSVHHSCVKHGFLYTVKNKIESSILFCLCSRCSALPPPPHCSSSNCAGTRWLTYPRHEHFFCRQDGVLSAAPHCCLSAAAVSGMLHSITVLSVLL